MQDCLTTDGIPGVVKNGDFIPTEIAGTVDANYHKGTNGTRDNRLCVLDRHPSGDRYRFEYSPALRACKRITGEPAGSPFRVVDSGKHRCLFAVEAERLMGWPEGSTEKGITSDGKQINLSRSRRISILGNGIIPQEIESIANSLKEELCKLKFCNS